MFLIKPDAFRREKVGDILKQLEAAYTIINMEFFRFDIEFVDKFYEEHLEKDFYSLLQATMISGPSLAIMIQENWLQEHKRLAGSIRTLVRSGHNTAENGIHCSDSFDADIRECSLIFGTPL